MSPIELGGFADEPEDIEGTEEELRIFNWCLAHEYYSAVVGEDFESLGEVLDDVSYWHDLMNTVEDHLKYSGDTDKEVLEDVGKLYD